MDCHRNDLHLAIALGLTSLTYIARRSVAFNSIQHTTAGQLTYQRLRALTEEGLDQLADKMARGTSLTEAEAQLLQFGPFPDLQPLDTDIEYQERVRYELAKVYDRLAMMHAWTFEFPEQEAMLLRGANSGRDLYNNSHCLPMSLRRRCLN